MVLAGVLKCVRMERTEAYPSDIERVDIMLGTIHNVGIWDDKEML